MAFTWPVALADFFDPLPVAQVSFELNDAKTISVNGGGEVIAHQLGARLWMGTVSIGVSSLQDAAAFEARIALLQQPGASFQIYDRRKPWPRNDPGASLLSGFTPVIASLSGNNRELALGGLPAGYTIAQGDMLSFAYSSNPARRALHRVVTGGTADGTGVTGLLEVIPYIRPGAIVGAVVTLDKPLCKAVLTEASYGTGRATISRGASFSWMQTLR